MNHTATVRTATDYEAVRAQLSRLAAEGAMPRARDLAGRLGISEAELVALQGARPLRAPPGRLLERLPALGELMVLCRNEACVHERHGCYERVQLSGTMGLVLGTEIDLRLFLSHWVHGYVCRQRLPSGERESIQYFDACGRAVHKIYRTQHTDPAAWQALVDAFCDAPGDPPAVRPPLPRAPAQPRPVDREALVADWKALQDTHDFHLLLERHGVTRTQALALAGPPFAYRVADSAPGALLADVAARGVPIMVFVGNPGTIQIHTGPVHRVAWRGPWLNVLDARFNLHLDTRQLRESWVVRKPTRDGIVTSLELFDEHGELIAQCFGARKPGQPEREDWRAAVARLLDRAAP